MARGTWHLTPGTELSLLAIRLPCSEDVCHGCHGPTSPSASELLVQQRSRLVLWQTCGAVAIYRLRCVCHFRRGFAIRRLPICHRFAIRSPARIGTSFAGLRPLLLHLLLLGQPLGPGQFARFDVTDDVIAGV